MIFHKYNILKGKLQNSKKYISYAYNILMILWNLFKPNFIYKVIFISYNFKCLD